MTFATRSASSGCGAVFHRPRSPLSPLFGATSPGSAANALVTNARGAVNTYVKVSVEDVASNAQHVADEVQAKTRRVRAKVEESMDDVEDAARFMGQGDVARVHFLGQDLLIDDQDATMVLVFPRGKPYGPIDLDEPVKDPYGQAHKIFWRQDNLASQETMSEGFETFQRGGSVSQGHYQKVVRSKLLHLFRKSGLQVLTFPSIDGDEVFAKISLDVDGPVIKHLAQRFSYTMPFKEEAYKDVKPHGIFQGNKPMYRGKKAVTAFAPYNMEIQNLMGDFRTVDSIRITEMLLNSLVSLEQLKVQGVISSYFAVAKHEDVQLIHREWLERKSLRCCGSNLCSTLAAVLVIPKYGTQQGVVRNFFGEEIAFFFRWFAFYTQMLGYLGVFGVLWHFMDDGTTGHMMNVSFAAILVVWTTAFNQLFRNRMAQASQEWGMKDYELACNSIDRAGYRPELEGTWLQLLLRVCSAFLLALFCVGFIFLISSIEERKMKQRESLGEDGAFFKDHGSMIVVASIKITSIAWGYVAPMLAEMQNHRTQARFDDALTLMLAWVKIFVTLWNFVYVALIKTWVSPTCAESLADAAELIWGDHNFSSAPAFLREQALQELQKPHFSYLRNHTHHLHNFDGSVGSHHEQQVCIRGCHPATPELSHTGATTNCALLLQYELVTFFFVHIVYTVAFLLFPMVKVKVDMLLELRKARNLKRDGQVAERARYSWLEFQAKCPPYEYGSWGGSRVEDFLECAIGFALITCFGVLFPLLAFFGFLANLVEYRLLAYRMTHVTRRPLPRFAAGIGSWQTLFEQISGLAVVVNVMLVTFVMYPMRGFELPKQLGIFVVLEHALLGVRNLIDIVIPDEPLDVRRIDDFNAHFKKTMVKYPELKEIRCDPAMYAQADLGLLPGAGLALAPAEAAWAAAEAAVEAEEANEEAAESEEASGSASDCTESGEGAEDKTCWGDYCGSPVGFRPL